MSGNRNTPLRAFQESWIKSSEDLFVFLRPELTMMDLPDPHLFFLYEDCYHTLLIGRYNAAIVMMGILLEALMKERIRLKTGGDMRGTYGKCLRKITENQLVQPADIRFLRQCRNLIRNPSTHAY